MMDIRERPRRSDARKARGGGDAVKLSDDDLELEAKALLKRASRIEADAVAQREQTRRLIEHLRESRTVERPPAERIP